MLVETIFCTLVRFRCIGCGKTFTNYPDFAIPYKRYIRQTILNLSKSYIEDDQKSYQDAAMKDGAAMEYSDSNKEMAPSTLYRWISALADFFIVYKKKLAASKIFIQLNVNSIHLIIPKKKYRTSKRKLCLQICRYLFINCNWSFSFAVFMYFAANLPDKKWMTTIVIC